MMSEQRENLVVPGESFQYLPFQKALPYFPNYGYQVTLHFKDADAEPNKKTQDTIRILIKELSSELAASYLSIAR